MALFIAQQKENNVKIVEKLSDGVFLFHNGMIGTKDLPVMVASLAHRVKKNNPRVKHLLDNIKTPTSKLKLSWRQQLAGIHKLVRVA